MIAEFKTIAEKTSESVVELLEETLNRVKEKSFSGAMIILFEPNGTYHTATSETLSVLKTLGAIEQLKFDLLYDRSKDDV